MQNKKKSLAKELAKECRIYDALVNEGFDISYSTVCNTVRGSAHFHYLTN